MAAFHVTIPPGFDDKIFVIDNIYEDIGGIYKHAMGCPSRWYRLKYIEGWESVSGYPSQSIIALVKSLLGISRIVEKSDEMCLFGAFRSLMAGAMPHQIGVHLDTQPWAMIVYVSSTMDRKATGIYRHRATGVFDLSALSAPARKAFEDLILERDRYAHDEWELIYATPFRQNSAILFRAGDLLHSNIGTWGVDRASARTTQNFNFVVD